MCFSGCSWTKSHTQTQNSKKLCLQGKAELAWECVLSAHCLICTCKIHQDGFYKQVTPTSCADETFILPLSRVLILILDKKFWYNGVFVQKWTMRKTEREDPTYCWFLCYFPFHSHGYQTGRFQWLHFSKLKSRKEKNSLGIRNRVSI